MTIEKFPSQVPIRYYFSTDVLSHARDLFLSDIEQRLDGIIEIASEPDWDTYGANRISPLAVTCARDILRNLVRMGLLSPLLEHMAPSRDGGVILEWGENGSDELIVAACPDESISYLRVQTVQGERSFEERDDVPLADIVELVGKVVGVPSLWGVLDAVTRSYCSSVGTGHSLQAFLAERPKENWRVYSSRDFQSEGEGSAERGIGYVGAFGLSGTDIDVSYEVGLLRGS